MVKEIKNLRVLICGGRHFTDYTYLRFICNDILKDYFDYNIEIVSGHCKGCDLLGEKFANECHYKLKIFPADWKKYGKSAGIIRNLEMLEYISKTTCLVIGFISDNSKGTKFTLDKAQKMNIKTYTIRYEIEDIYFELFEGVRKNKDNNTFEIDFENDLDTDFIKFKKSIYCTSYKNNLRWYGYKVIKKPENKEDIMEFLKYIKTPEGLQDNGVLEMINRCVDNFYTESLIKHYDCIFKVPSSSNLVLTIIKIIIKNFDKTNMIDLEKLSPDNFDFDWDAIKKELQKQNKSDGYIENLKNMLLKSYVGASKKWDYFSISKIHPKYRKWLKPMLKIKDKEININDYKNILVVDDTFTSGGTFDMVISLLNSLNYNGNITFLTLMYNG